MTIKELVGTILGILFIVGTVVVFSLWVLESDRRQAEKRAEEKQRIERMEEENRLLKAKCSVGTLTWQMEYAK